MSNVIREIYQCDLYAVPSRDLRRYENEADVVVLSADRDDEPTIYFAKLGAPDPQPHHYFGSTSTHWATGATRAEVLTKLASRYGKELLRRMVKEHGGVYAWTCKVGVHAEGAKYPIEFYEPVGVPKSAPQEFNIVNAKGHTTPIDRGDRK